MQGYVHGSIIEQSVQPQTNTYYRHKQCVGGWVGGWVGYVHGSIIEQSVQHLLCMQHRWYV